MKQEPKTSRQKAIELVEHFSYIVYPYMGSSMLTNQTHGLTILKNAKACAKKVVEEIIEEWQDRSDDFTNDCIKWWSDTYKEIDSVICEDIDIVEGFS